VKNLALQANDHDLEQLTIPFFGYELIREILLDDLLGKDSPQILYWAGKNLARKYPVESIDEIIRFFQLSGWGNLSLVDEKNQEYTFELTGDIISHRLQWKKDCSFQLEAGFLAQQIQQQKKKLTEAFEQPKKRTNKVVFTVKWDKKDIVDE
jgi:predicted hydrocarbon binding protein